MLTNYLKIAIRNLLKQKTYAAINIFGLSVGLACCILILLFVQHELQHDTFHQNADKIFRLVLEETAQDGSINRNTLFPDFFAKAVTEEFPTVVYASGFIRTWIRINHQEKSFVEEVGEADGDFLEMFAFPLLAGDPATALRQPNNTVISESVARKFFGDGVTNYSEVLGKVLTFHAGSQSQDFIVTGVMRDVPQISRLQFDVLIPIEHYKIYGIDSNWAGATTVYIQVANAGDLRSLEAAFPPFVEKHLAQKVKSRRGASLAADLKEALKVRLQPLTEMYLDEKVASHYTLTSRPLYSLMLATIAALVLTIACFNFMTLATGRSVRRAVEVGMRKVIGATRLQVMRQFWGEAILLSVLAMLLGIGMAELFLPAFNTLAQKELSLSVFDNPVTLMILLGIMLVTGLFAGSYPAVVLSRFQPIQVLKGENRIAGRSRLTRLLVVLQYALSIALMIATLVISRQLHFLRTKELGYSKEQVVVISVPGEQFSERYKTKLAQYNSIISAAASDRSFTSGWQTRSLKTDQGEWQTVRLIRIDPDYLKTLGIDLIAGRNFSATHPADSMEAVIVNEAFVKTFGWDTPLDKRLEGLATREGKQPPAIIGVVKDFHIDKLDRAIEPLILHMNPDNHGIYYVFVRIRPDDIPATIELLRKTWESVTPNAPFNYSFLDENLEAQYRNEERWQKIITYAAVFAIAISCLGLLGLASLAVSRRTKEIGVRKVLGASVTNILTLLTGDFVKLVVISNLVAWPVVWFVMRHWLQNFAYRIGLGWWMFGSIGALALLIAIFTVGAQAMRAALANPVEALRYE